MTARQERYNFELASLLAKARRLAQRDSRHERIVAALRKLAEGRQVVGYAH